jgi:hypothetical protein
MTQQTPQLLQEYFQRRKPDCRVEAPEFTGGFSAWRFYFVKDGKNLYIFDIDRFLLDDWSESDIIRRLEELKWEQVLEAHPGQIPCFTSRGFEFRTRPS